MPAPRPGRGHAGRALRADPSLGSVAGSGHSPGTSWLDRVRSIPIRSVPALPGPSRPVPAALERPRLPVVQRGRGPAAPPCCRSERPGRGSGERPGGARHPSASERSAREYRPGAGPAAPRTPADPPVGAYWRGEREERPQAAPKASGGGGAAPALPPGSLSGPRPGPIVSGEGAWGDPRAPSAAPRALR